MTSRIDLPADAWSEKWLEADETAPGLWWLCRMQPKGPFRIRALSEFECHLVNAAPPVEGGEAVAWMYRGDPYFDGRQWHGTNQVTTSKQLAMFNDSKAIPLYTRPAESEALLKAKEALLDANRNGYTRGNEALIAINAALDDLKGRT